MGEAAVGEAELADDGTLLTGDEPPKDLPLDQRGRGDELIGLLLNAPSLPNDDCVVFLVGRSASNPDIVYVTEGWTSQHAHSTFFATERAQALVATLQPLLAGEPRYADEVPVGGKAAF